GLVPCEPKRSVPRRRPESIGPAMPAAGETFGNEHIRERFVAREQLQPFAELAAECFEKLGVIGAARQVVALELGEASGERIPLALANGNVIDEGGIPSSHNCSRVRATGSAELVDGNIDRVEEPAAGWRIGAAPARIGKKQGMQGIDPEEIRAAGAGPFSKPRQILEIADAPVPLGPQSVELAGDAPGPALPQPLRNEAADAGRGARHLRRFRRWCGGETGGDVLLRPGCNAQSCQKASLGALAD